LRIITDHIPVLIQQLRLLLPPPPQAPWGAAISVVDSLKKLNDHPAHLFRGRLKVSAGLPDPTRHKEIKKMNAGLPGG
jgi:hypothetical protein